MCIFYMASKRKHVNNILLTLLHNFKIFIRLKELIIAQYPILIFFSVYCTQTRHAGLEEESEQTLLSASAEAAGEGSWEAGAKALGTLED